MRNVFLSLAFLAAAASPALAQEETVEASVAAPAPEAPATPPVAAARGQMVVAANGARIGRVTRLADDGSPQVIFEGKVVTVPLSTLSEVDGRLVSSLSPAEIAAL